ncbi:uncharacterized protein EI97DRAFT_393825 [Westerdykella ornata]|uniref:Protein kinase domain-containing protein n=1 Tax=Westerdykella ornata TaxID=318751 RepID=A0A6A6JRS7_WESOR|nr:uncharacterized protein EI97DRAFT_393825 [Westerdykella ornata]KAF2278974.1 hypothetical protein EI97DRAFT_393825 [Westerdykella ornata]
MSSKFIQEAFQRHPRPQWPTKAALLKDTWQKQDEKKNQTTSQQLPLQQCNPWTTLAKLGELVQAGKSYTVGLQCNRVIMVRQTKKEVGEALLEKTKLLQHRNLHSIEAIFQEQGSIFFQLEHLRFTLEEILNVHISLEEHQIRNLEECVWQTLDLTPNVDLQQLGCVLLQCMNGRPSNMLQDPNFVREQRQQSKFFGLEHGETWSSCKLLVDFLDDLLNEAKPALSKLDRPHQYVSGPLDPSILLPFIELVPLECFALWRPAVNV